MILVVTHKDDLSVKELLNDGNNQFSSLIKVLYLKFK